MLPLVLVSLITAASTENTQAAIVFGRVSAKVLTTTGETKRGTTQGSAVIVAPGVVVTNYHVVKGASALKLSRGSTSWPAELLRFDEKRDLALLRVEGLTDKPVRLGAVARLKVGDPVFAIGAPRGLELTLTNGIVSAIREENGQQLIQTSAPIAPGSSGGGLFDSTGQLVGVTTAKADEGLGFAVAADDVTSLLRLGLDGGVQEVPRLSEWTVTKRPSTVTCKLDADLTWGLFSDGPEILERSPVSKSVFISQLDTTEPVMIADDSKRGERTPLVIHDLSRRAQIISFSSQSTGNIVHLAFEDEFDSIRIVVARVAGYKGEPRLLTREGRCSAAAMNSAEAQERKASAGIRSLSMEEISQLAALRKACERGSATSCREAAAKYREIGDVENAKKVSDKLSELE